MNLADLKPGSTAIVASLASHGADLYRLREMGVLPGSEVKLVRFAPLGDPLEIALGGTRLSLRRQEAELIEIHPPK